MSDPLKVSLENILPLTYARDHFSQIVSEVQKDKLYILTKGGKPAVAIIDVKYLEDISGGHVQQKDINEEIKKDPEKVGLPPMIEHPSTPLGTSPSTPLPRADSGQVGTSPPKPAGFAAPRPSSLDSARDKSGQAPKPPQNPPIPKSAAPPPISKPEPKPTPKPMPTPPPIKPETLQSNPSLVMPQPSPKPTANVPPPTPISNKPLTTLPPVGNQNSNSQVDVQFSPDESALQEKSQDGKIPDGEKIAPDDEAPPAQYAGENPPAGGDEEPEDMALD